jgi:hypothetical protein
LSQCNSDWFCHIIDLLLKIDHGSVVKASLGWSLVLRPCVTLVARLMSGLLYFLSGVATRGLVALVVLAIVIPSVPEASFRVAAHQHSVTMALKSRRHVPVEDTGCCPSSCMSVRWVRYYSLCICGLGSNC